MNRNILITLSIILLFSCERNEVQEQYDPNPQTNFDALWNILDTRYCYFDAKDIDWDDVQTHYNEQIPEVEDVFQLFDLFAEMLDTLKDGHVNLYSPFDISRCRDWFEDYPVNFNSDIVYSDRYLTKNYKTASGMHYNTIDDGNVGLIRYSSFSSGISSVGMLYIDAYFADCKGIILDLRHNGGGSLINSERLAACFFKEETITGYKRHKTGDGHNDFSEPIAFVTKPSEAFIDWSDKKVVVLCNRNCYSATNDFIVRVLKAPNVTVIGGKTGGGGGLPLSQELPNGWMVRFSSAPMYDSDMNHTEFGVDPDIFVNTTTEDEDKGFDTIIETAIELIVSE